MDSCHQCTEKLDEIKATVDAINSLPTGMSAAAIVVVVTVCGLVLFAAPRPTAIMLALSATLFLYVVMTHLAFRLSGWLLPVVGLLVPLVIVTCIYAASLRMLRPYPRAQ